MVRVEVDEVRQKAIGNRLRINRFGRKPPEHRRESVVEVFRTVLQEMNNRMCPQQRTAFYLSTSCARPTASPPPSIASPSHTT